jgi:ABC-type uncharacterized transport system permease subunit
MPTPALALVAIFAYLAATAALMLRGGRQASRIPALAIAALAIVVHATLAFGMHRGGLDLHFFAALSVVGMGIAAMTLLVNAFRPVAGLGVIVFPLAALVLALDVFVASPTTAQPIDWQIKLHVAFALVGFSVLGIAAVLAILLALQEQALRSHRLGSGLIATLPPLTMTESLMFRLIAAGFVLLTLTLLSGVLFVDNLFAQNLVQKTALSIVAWLVFGVLLFGRWRWGWRGRRAVQLTLSGMAVLLLAFLGSKFVLEVLLQRGV